MKHKVLQKMNKVLVFVAGLLLAGSMAFGQYSSTLVAGGASLPLGLPASSADAYAIGSPGPMAVAPNGDIAWSDYYDGNGLIYWDASEDVVKQLVPQGSANTGFDGPAADATVGGRIMGVAFDSNNDVYFTVNHQVMKVDMATEIFSLVAGTGNNGAPDFSLPAKEIDLNTAAGLVWNDDDSKLYINILGVHMVASMDPVTEDMELLIGTGVRADDGTTGLGLEKDTREPFGLEYIKDADGTEWLYIATQQKRVHKYNIQTGIRSLLAGNGGWGYGGDGGLAVDAMLKQPHDLSVDPGNTAVYFGDHQANVVRKVDLKTGLITKFAGTNESGDRLTGDNGPANEAILNRAIGTDFDPDGNMIISERTSKLIRKVDMTTNIISTLTGYADAPSLPMPSAGAQATELGINTTGVVAWGTDVYFFDNNSKVIVKMADDGTTSVYAGVEGETGFNGGGAVDTAHFSAINQMILDSNGDIIASDHGHDVVYKIDVAEGMVSVLAGTGSGGYDAAQEGGPATEAKLKDPEGIAFNADESLLYINDKSNYCVRVVDMATGNISLYAGVPTSRGEVTATTPILEGKFRDNRAIAVDADGNVFVGSSRYHKIYKMDGTNIEILASGFTRPLGMYFAAGSIWVSDYGSVKLVDPATGEVSIVANDTPGSYDLWPVADGIYVAGMQDGLYKMAIDAGSTLGTIQGYADADDAGELTVDMLTALDANAIELNLAAYKVAVADSTAATLPFINTVQSLVSDVNAQEVAVVVAAVDAMAAGDDASALTLDHLAIAKISGVVDANLARYQAMIADSAGIADAGAIQAIVNTGNMYASLAVINDMASNDNADDLTFKLMKDAGADAANIMQLGSFDYMPFYKAEIVAAEAVADTAALKAIIAAANIAAEAGKPANAIAAINDMAVAGLAADLSFALIMQAGADAAAVNFEYLEYYKAGVAAAEGVADAAALDAIIAAANTAGDVAEAAAALAAIDGMAAASDASDLAMNHLVAAGATGLVYSEVHYAGYQAAIEAEDGVADAAALQALVDAVNLGLAIDKIVGFADADDAAEMTNEDLVAAGVDPTSIVPTNLVAYQTAVADAAGTDVDESAKIEALVVAANAQVVTDAVAAIQQMAVDADASTLTEDILTNAGLTFDGKYLAAYQAAIAAAGTLADAAAIQTLLDVTTTCETVREMPGSNDAMDLTVEMLTAIGIANSFDVFLEAYQLGVFDADTIADCGAGLQTIIDAANLASVLEMAANDDAADLTEAMLLAVGATNVMTAKMADYITAIEDADALADLAALQAIIDAVNTVNVELFGKNAVRIYPNPSSGIFTVEVSTRAANMKVLDITGRVVLDRELTQTKNEIDMSYEAKGVYFVQLRSSGKVVITKFVLQ